MHPIFSLKFKKQVKYLQYNLFYNIIYANHTETMKIKRRRPFLPKLKKKRKKENQEPETKRNRNRENLKDLTSKISLTKFGLNLFYSRRRRRFWLRKPPPEPGRHRRRRARQNPVAGRNFHGYPSHRPPPLRRLHLPTIKIK